MFERIATAGAVLERRGEIGKRLPERRVRGADAWFRGDLGPDRAAVRSAERMGEVAGGLLQDTSGPAQTLEILGFVAFGGHRVANQLQELAAAERGAEKQLRDLRQLVGLIHDHGIGPGQELGESLLAQGQVRQQEMMIDDHQLRGLGLATRTHEMAGLNLRAPLAQAVVGRGGDEGIER